ncbi:MAG: hypothetical protein K0S93_415 [Nitrososphaeraceae archaeon]|nr:hypothetical protein [Nitrososphaeraceae archaeon]
MVTLSADVISSQCIKTTIGDGNNLVFLSGIAITPTLEGITSLEGKETWLREELHIDEIGPQWSTFPAQHDIVAMAFLNSIYKGSSVEKESSDEKENFFDRFFQKDKQRYETEKYKQRYKAGWAIDEVIGTYIKNRKITLKLQVAVYHPHVKLLRVGFYITARGKLLDECDNIEEESKKTINEKICKLELLNKDEYSSLILSINTLYNDLCTRQKKDSPSCPKCTNTCPENSRFCNRCGYSLLND